VAKSLNFLRILPIFRIRNGVAAVRQNDDSLNKAVDVIHDHVDLYLFPEGTHRTKHSLMRMGKGLFHIALDANKQFGDKNPAVAKLLNFFRILPIFRIRNGVAAVRQNDDSLNKAVDVIHDHVDLYLFPEGTHRTKHSLMRMGKGLFHIAVDANKQFGDKSPVYIIPTAIEYGDYFRFRSTAMINFGQPINVTEFFKHTTEENEAANINLLKDQLHDEISKLFTYIPDDDDYEAIWEIVKMKNEKRSGGLYKKMLRNRATVDKILAFKEKQPEEAQSLFKRVMDFAAERKRQKITSRNH
jgi:1-acyl-sn-glycerol-3-phosphate acyltransferase